MGHLTQTRGTISDMNQAIREIVAKWTKVIDSLVWTDIDERVATLNLGRSQSE